MEGPHHGNAESQRSIASWCTISTASIATDIRPGDNAGLNERSSLLENQLREGHSYPDYGLKVEQSQERRQLGQGKLMLLSLNNHDRTNRCDSSSSGAGSDRGAGGSGESSQHYLDPMYYYGPRSHLCDIRLFGILSILVSGVIIATYLLITESQLPLVGFALHLVNHNIWSKMPIPSGSKLNRSVFVDVLVMHTGGKNCGNSIRCIHLLEQMQIHQQSNDIEMPYNFLLADDGQTYEVRGWDHASGLKLPSQEVQYPSLVIGFIGNYTNIAPSTTILLSALSLLRESLRRQKLLHEYRIYGIRNVTLAKNDADELFKHIANWPHFMRLFEMH